MVSACENAGAVGILHRTAKLRLHLNDETSEHDEGCDDVPLERKYRRAATVVARPMVKITCTALPHGL
jgi:hypothetical protein